jgi:hypothetical protein
MYDHQLLRAGLLGGGLLLALCAAAQGSVPQHIADPHGALCDHDRAVLAKGASARHCKAAPSGGLSCPYLADAAWPQGRRRDEKAMADVV